MFSLVITAQKAFSGGYFTNIGDAQYSQYFLRSETTNSTPKTLTIDGQSPGSLNLLKLSPKSTWTFEIKTSAYNSTDGISASFISGLDSR